MSEYRSFLVVQYHHHMHERDRATVNMLAAKSHAVEDEWLRIYHFHMDKIKEYRERIDNFK